MNHNKLKSLTDKLIEKCMSSQYSYEQYKIRNILATITELAKYETSEEPISVDEFLCNIMRLTNEGER